MSETFDLAVVGGGCAGLAVAREAATRGLSCVLIDHAPLASFSSVRNQGWLHSGALYIVSESSEAELFAADFAASGTLIRSLARTTGVDFVGQQNGLMVFESDADLNRSEALLAAARFRYRRVPRAEVFRLEPNLYPNPRLVGGIITDDTTVDTPRFLSALAGEATARGCHFYSATESRLDNLEFRQLDGVWEIRDGGTSLHAANVVLASGPLLPNLMAKAFGVVVNAEIKKCLVLALGQAVTSRLVMVRVPSTGLMNIAPYNGGTTVNLGRQDQPAASSDDVHIADQLVGDLLYQLEDWLPGIAAHIPLAARLYACQKLVFPNSAEFSRKPYVHAVAPSVTAFYPGKFTLCLVGASRLLDQLGIASLHGRGILSSAGPIGAVLHPGRDERYASVRLVQGAIAGTLQLEPQG